MCVSKPSANGQFTIVAKVNKEVKSFEVHENELYTKSLMEIFAQKFPDVPISEIYLISVNP